MFVSHMHSIKPTSDKYAFADKRSLMFEYRLLLLLYLAIITV